MAPVEGFFLPAASIKAQKIVKGIRRNGTSLIPEYIKKAIHETWKRLKGSVVSVFDRHSHKLMGWKACTLHDLYLFLYAAPYLGLLTHFASYFFVAGLERRIFKC